MQPIPTPEQTVPPRRNTEPAVLLSFALAAFFCAVALYVRIRLLAAPLERDEGGFAYLAQQMLQGIPPFASGYTMKLPGIHAAYALAIALFGESATGVHLGLLGISVLNTAGVFLLARRFIPREAAAVSAGIYALLAVSQDVLGVFAHATHYVTAFALAGIVLYFRWAEQNRLPALFMSGLCLGIAITMKQNGIFFAVLVICLLGAALYRQKAAGQHTVRVLGAWLGGLLLPYGLILLAMATTGNLSSFWFWTTSYTLEYAQDTPLADSVRLLKQGMQQVTRTTLPLWLLAAAGIGFRPAGLHDHRRWFPLVFLLVSALAIIPGGLFYQHYFVLVLPALALHGGMALVRLQQAGSRWFPVGAGALALGAVLLAGSVTVHGGKAYLFTLPPRNVSILAYGATLFADASHAIAGYIQQNSTSADTVAVLGSEPQIYFYAQRRAATRFIHMYSLTDGNPYALSMWNSMLDEVQATMPKFIVVSYEKNSWLLETAQIKEALAPLAPLLERDYQLVGRISMSMWGEMRAAWGADAAIVQPLTYSPAVVLQRKT